MKMKQGFSAIEGLLIVIILCAVGFGGWYVWDQQQEETPVESQENTQQAETDTFGWNIYENRRFSFSYPSDWEIIEVLDGDTVTSIDLKSPDYIPGRGEDFGTTLEGSLITINLDDTLEGSDSVQFIKDFIESDALTVSVSEVSELFMINGHLALSYGAIVDGLAAFGTFIDSDEGIYSIAYKDVPTNGGSTDIASAQYYNEYTALVNSFNIN